MSEDDPVARNRATPRRRTPGRRELGADVTRRVWLVTAAALLCATAVLVAVLVLR